MKKLGIVGYRGMVGSVLMDRMSSENDFAFFENFFFSTSQAGLSAPKVKNANPTVLNAESIAELKKMDVILTCQGGDYTKKIYPQLRTEGWNGYWIDAASTLRMERDSIIILDPVNLDSIKAGLHHGMKTFVGGNCTVSLMLLATGGLFKADAVEWVTSMTYQAASGAGAKNMVELLKQMQFISEHLQTDLQSPQVEALEVEKKLASIVADTKFPKDNFGRSLAGNLIPWIDVPWENGQSKEEWKGSVEANKILNTKSFIPIDGTCVRVGAMRCHSQGLTIKLKKDIPLNEIEQMIKEHNSWVDFVPNDREESVNKLSPLNVSGKLNIPIGRVRKMNLGPQYLNAFTVGDQLLWGAAEPLRRMLRIYLEM